MSDIAQLDLKARGDEARLRALLEDLLDYYKGVYPGQRLGLGVWFAKNLQSQVHNLLVLFTGPRLNKFMLSDRQSLLWKTGQNEPPFVNIHASSVDDFSDLLASNSQSLSQYRANAEVLYFDKSVLNPEILQEFHVITEPSGLMKGWYLTPDQYQGVFAVDRTLASWQQAKPELGLVKTWEAENFEYCRGLIHVEVGQRWLPLSRAGVSAYGFHRDAQQQRPGYFLFQGGSLYQLLKLEVKTNCEYSAQVLEQTRDNAFTSRDDTYVEVYLRAVHPPEQPTA